MDTHLTIEHFEKFWELVKDSSFRDACSPSPLFEGWLREGNIDELTKSIIRSYQQLCSSDINRYLRREGGQYQPLYSHLADMLDRALNTLPPLTNKVVWRNEGDREEMLRWGLKHKGQSLLVPSFWSTYIKPENWRATVPTFKIFTSANSNARSIAEYTGWQLAETEALYKRNTTFRILGVEPTVIWGENIEEVIVLEEIEFVESPLIAFQGYSISQDDADHDTYIPSLID